jgi:hypothetical protein
MPIHEKNEYPNLIIITPNMGVGDLDKEVLPSIDWPRPPSAFAFAKENWYEEFQFSLLENVFIFNTYQRIKKTSEADYLSSRFGG